MWGESMSAVASATRKTARKAKGDGHLRRAEILEAAERIFVAEGYEGATIPKIADDGGGSSNTTSILHGLVEGTLAQLLVQNRDIAGRPLDAVVRTKMILDAYMRWGLEHPNAYQLVYLSRGPATTDPI